MKSLTTDTPKDNLENSLNLFYVLEHETWVRRYGPPPECPDISLDDLMRGLIAKFLPEVECPQDPADFSCMMAEWLYDDVDTIEGTLALLYSAAWAFAELRERLKQYEDAGLTPRTAMLLSNVLRAVGEEFNCRTEYVGEALVKFAELRKAADDGRLLILPLKVGQAVYFVLEDLPVFYPETNGWYIGEADVTEVCLRGFAVDPIGGDEKIYFYPYDDIGKTIFLTREEAEVALERFAVKNG